jgi:hypothetical protein
MGTNESRRALALAVVVVTSAMFGVGAASAQGPCFESGIGCTDDHNIPKSILRTLSCDALWTVRNMMYDTKGYCFQTAKAQAVFSNEGCYVVNASLIPFNAYERGNIDRIAAVEREKGC